MTHSHPALANHSTSAPDLTETEFHTLIHSAIGKPYDQTKSHRREHTAKWATSVVRISQKVIRIQVLLDFKAPDIAETDRKRLIKLA